MKVLFVSRPDNFTHPGGDSLHLEFTAHYLKGLGVEINIWHGEELDLRNYDLIHFFNIARPTAILGLLKGEHPPLICSSIYIDYSEADAVVSPLRRFLQKGLGPHAMEYLKTLARSYKFKTEKLSLSYLLEGQAASVQKVLNHCQHLICSSEAEREIIKKSFDIDKLDYSILTLGVEHIPPLKNTNTKSGVICAARIEPLKNQLRLIKACNLIDETLYLVGSASRAHVEYYQQCRDIASKKVHFYGQKTIEETATSMSQSKVHVLASYYETTGLASLEALLNGCQIVVNDHPIQRELFGNRAHYCQANSSESIGEAIKAAMLDERDHRDWVIENFSWKKKAASIKASYDKVLRA